MKIFEQISFIYFERDRSDGHKNIVLSLENSSFSQNKKLERLYFKEKVRQNPTSGRWRFKLFK